MKTSRAYKKFMKCFVRGVQMVRRHHELMLSDNEDWDEANDDLFRAGIVFLVAAMDSYYTDRFCEALVPYIKRNGVNPKLDKLLQDSGLTTEKSIEMFGNKRPLRVLSNMVRRHLEMFVTQNFKTINNLYLCLGYDRPISLQAEQYSGRKNLVKSVERLIDRRHKIVHAGDYNQHGNLREIEYRRLLRKFIEVRRLVDATDAVLVRDKI